MLVLASGLDFVSDSTGEREIHVPHKWIYSHHSAIILNAVVKPQHLSPKWSHLHSDLCHISAFVTLLSVRPQELCCHSTVKWTGRDLNLKKSVNIPQKSNYAKRSVETLHVKNLFIYLFIWVYLLYLSDVYIKALNALRSIPRETGQKKIIV